MAFDAVKTLRRHGRRARRLVEGFPNGGPPDCRSQARRSEYAMKLLSF